MITQPPGSTTSSARVLSIIGTASGAVALILLPIVFGPIGAALGFVGYAKGDKPLGLWVGIGSVVTTIVGLVLSATVWDASS